MSADKAAERIREVIWMLGELDYSEMAGAYLIEPMHEEAIHVELSNALEDLEV